MSQPSTAYCITPVGRSAIATIAVVGPNAAVDVEPHFQSASGRRLGRLAVGAIAFGRWGESDGEELVICRREDSVEIHCHGGLAAARAILDRLRQTVEISESNAGWLEQQYGDAIQREAHEALAQVSTSPAAARLLAQAHGALRCRLEEIKTLRAQDASAAKADLQQLLDESKFGLHLTEPWRVTLAGAPNVGKSSLINRIVGYDRAVVFDQPGTTRDVVSATSPLAGWPICWSDTAGIRRSDDSLEQEGVRRAHSASDSADLIIHVLDATNLGAKDKLRQFPVATPVITVWNKIDLVEQVQPTGDAIALSAETGAGLDRLLERVADNLFGNAPTSLGHPLLFTHRQIDEVRQLLDNVAPEAP